MGRYKVWDKIISLKNEWPFVIEEVKWYTWPYRWNILHNGIHYKTECGKDIYELNIDHEATARLHKKSDQPEKEKFQVWDEVICLRLSEYDQFNKIGVWQTWFVRMLSGNGCIDLGDWMKLDQKRFALVNRPADSSDTFANSWNTKRDISTLWDNECIHCKTEEEAQYICKLFHEAWKTWLNWESYLDITYRDKDLWMSGTWSGSVYYLSDCTARNCSLRVNGYTILPASDFIEDIKCPYKLLQNICNAPYSTYWSGSPSKEDVTIRCDDLWLVSWEEITITDWSELDAFEKACVDRYFPAPRKNIKPFKLSDHI